MARLTGYHYRKFDINTDKRMATLEAIKGFGEGFSEIPNTAKNVEKSEVDSNGRYESR